MSTSLSSLIDVATDAKQTEEDWGKILDVCEAGSQNVKQCFQLIMKRMNNKNPHIVLRSIILLDACMQNIGENFAKEISSSYFFNEICNKSQNWHPQIVGKLCFMATKWTREYSDEFKYEFLFKLNKWLEANFPNIYEIIGQNEIHSRGHKGNRKHNATAQEEEDLAKAIALSLKEVSGNPNAKTASTPPNNSLYPSSTYTMKLNDIPNNQTAVNQNIPVNNATPKIPKVRALYDFQAEDENELSFVAGEVIVDVDPVNEHWWFGHNHRGEGLFPAQFVTKDVENNTTQAPVQTSKQKTQTNTSTSSNKARSPTPVIDESKIDQCLKLIDEADPTGEIKPDPPELINLEAQCRQMGPLIDQELEKVDRHYNSLGDLNRKIMEAFQTYNELMMVGHGSLQQQSTSQPSAWIPNQASGNPIVSQAGINSYYNYTQPQVSISSTMIPPPPQQQATSTGNFVPYNMYYQQPQYPNTANPDNSGYMSGPSSMVPPTVSTYMPVSMPQETNQQQQQQSTLPSPKKDMNHSMQNGGSNTNSSTIDGATTNNSSSMNPYNSHYSNDSQMMYQQTGATSLQSFPSLYTTQQPYIQQPASLQQPPQQQLATSQNQQPTSIYQHPY